MKTISKLKHVLAFGLGLSAYVAFGHDVAVHQAITYNAAESAFDDSPAYASFFSAISSDLHLVDATNSMVKGSASEDDPVSPNPPMDGTGGGYRSLNHFYDPLYASYGRGLSDFPPDFRVLEGTNSFAWASISNCAGVPYDGLHPINIWSWQNARDYEWLGLTATNQADRIMNLTNMFRAVGQVMHLLEDTSQPQHVRNEQHLETIPYLNRVVSISTLWRSPIEDYGNDHVNQLNYGDGSMLDWRNAGFTKLEDFWDRHKYNGSSSVALTADNNEDPNGGPNTLGLAEWCNGNFLGARHTYAEYFSLKT
ncbi:MAG TPA: hypothetical protein VHY30_02110 [Verrucomicrobiae bacterium]|jgi:hypothetical protein|nr:hypothetical protein [Verrucomicrobiae bacterium]